MPTINRAQKIINGIIIILLIIGTGVFVAFKLLNKNKSASIISTNFIGYDLARAVTGSDSGISMLLKPGTETHDFEPTPEDIINIKNAELFIYVGGESDAWVEDLLKNNDIPEEKTLRLMDNVELKEEELSAGMEDHEHEHENHGHHDEDDVEYDEHIWTSPVNAVRLAEAVRDKLSAIHPNNKEEYSENEARYASRLLDIDQKIRDVVAASSKKELIFGDRFPFRYFVDEYKLDYYAAFPGCSEQTEPSSQTIAFLIDKAKATNTRVILKIELTSDKLAQSIADEVDGKVMTMNAAHNISKADFVSGRTYADIMEDNIEVVKEALK